MSPWANKGVEGNIFNENEYARALRYISRTDSKYTEKISINEVIRQTELAKKLSFLKINGISDFFKREEIQDFNTIMSDIISGFCNAEITLGYLITGEDSFLNLYIAIDKEYINSLKSSLISYFPFIDLDINDNINSEAKVKIIERGAYGGVISGVPSNKMKGENKVFQIEKICKAMNEDSWGILVISKSIDVNSVRGCLQDVMEALTHVTGNIRSSVSNFGGVGIDVINYEAKTYSEILEKLLLRINKGISIGMWNTSAYYFANDIIACNKLKNSIISVFNGEESVPCGIQCIDIINENSYKNVIGNFISQFPVIKWEVIIPRENIIPSSISIYRYQTPLTSDELGVLFEIPRKEYPGFHIEQYVEFEVTERRKFNDIEVPEDEAFVVGEIINGREVSENSKNKNEYKIKLGDLNRHALIIGITGGGKSNTSKNLLKTLYGVHKKPFLVLESAKREYWELRNIKGFEDLKLFTLGAEDNQSIPYRINPFEFIDGTNIQTHIDFLLSTFKASFELYPPMPFVLETSLYEVYTDKGWDIVANKNTSNIDKFPVLDDLYFKVDEVIKRLGYAKEIESNVRAGLQARIYSLMEGSKGRMLNTKESIPMKSLLKNPTVLELEDIGDDDVKAFIMGILLVQLYEYRKINVGKNKLIEHVLVIEEAHRLLKNVSDAGGANPRAKAVEFFCNLLAEIRSYGQGIIIADQIPTKLTPDTLKNTNLKIIHRTVMAEDREAVGNAMNMTQDQIEYLSVLKRGYAAVFSEGDTRPKLVKMPLIRSDNKYSRSEVLNMIKNKLDENILKSIYKEVDNNEWCNSCKYKCIYGDIITQRINSIKDTDNFAKWSNYIINNIEKATDLEVLIDRIIKFSFSKEMGKANIHEKICFTLKLLSTIGIEEKKKQILISKYACLLGERD